MATKKQMKWIKNQRGEYVCEHGVGHPDLLYAERQAKGYISNSSWEQKVRTGFIHGCCGCCSRKDFPGKKMSEEAYAKAERDDVLSKAAQKSKELVITLSSLKKQLDEAKVENDRMERALAFLESKLNG